MLIQVPRGFELAAVHCGIKSVADKEDLSLIACRQGAVAAGVYTQNLVFAAPVAVDRKRTPATDIRAVVVNSGNANACTGERGLKDAQVMASWAAESIGAPADKSLVMSTGIIGEFLPMARIQEGIRNASSHLEATATAFEAAARGITTTDQYIKVASKSLRLGSAEVRLAGMAKGAGMIGPRMATMLGVVLTDAQLEPSSAHTALQQAVACSFNCISVEGHMSTNDTVLLLASGQATNSPLAGAHYDAFVSALTEICVDLAKMIPNDGEGSSHLITIDVHGCASHAAARQIAKSVAESALVKTAIAGGDPNWGRIVSAVGYAGVPLDASRIGLALNGVTLYRHGAPVPFDAAAVSESIKRQRDTHIELTLAEGSESCRFWTSDLNHEYIRVNADYHT